MTLIQFLKQCFTPSTFSMRPACTLVWGGILCALCFCQSAQALVVLQYHHVSDSTPASTSISPELFKAHMAFLEKNKFKVIALEDLIKLLNKGENLPDRTALITFDDGYISVYKQAFPVLQSYKWPFTVFINTKPHDEKNHLFMSWDQLRELTKKGGTIANHSDSHPHFIRQQDYENFDEWQVRREKEIDFAQKRIQKEIGKAVKAFAYPFGEYDERLQDLLKEKGYVAFGQQSGPIANYHSLQALPRFAFGGSYGKMEDFTAKVLSLPFPQAKVQVTDNNGRVIKQPELPESLERPVLRISSPMIRYIKNLTCYASGQGEIPVELNTSVAVVRAKKPIPTARSRYNCTANAGNGRFYWHSQMFIRRLPDGSWYNE
ncbi:Poly-beta-1,6-N-acetyl-D-glucosamine N-deacetylase [Thalassocella blandensis]|nr:Poly-beta-1,6-N-acetyl-D-glucosamine N-deacetylase [Thalassocella blandensis]